ncbi:MAG: hypothetical protein ABGY42_10080, partial [bacterium]
MDIITASHRSCSSVDEAVNAGLPVGEDSRAANARAADPFRVFVVQGEAERHAGHPALDMHV